MTKEDLADILICVGKALLERAEPAEPHVELQNIEEQTISGVIEAVDIPTQEQQTVPDAGQAQNNLQAPQTLTIEVPDLSSKIKQIFDSSPPDMNAMHLQAKEQEIQMLKNQIAELQNSNNTATAGTIG